MDLTASRPVPLPRREGRGSATATHTPPEPVVVTLPQLIEALRCVVLFYPTTPPVSYLARLTLIFYVPLGLFWIAIGWIVVAGSEFGPNGACYLNGVSALMALLLFNLSTAMLITLGVVVTVGIVSTAYRAAQLQAQRSSTSGAGRPMPTPFDDLPPFALTLFRVLTGLNFTSAAVTSVIQYALNGASVADLVMVGCFASTLSAAALLQVVAIVRVLPLIPPDAPVKQLPGAVDLTCNERLDNLVPRRVRFGVFLLTALVTVMGIVAMQIVQLLDDIVHARLGTPFLPYEWSSSGSLTVLMCGAFFGAALILYQIWQR